MVLLPDSPEPIRIAKVSALLFRLLSFAPNHPSSLHLEEGKGGEGRGKGRGAQRKKGQAKRTEKEYLAFPLEPLIILAYLLVDLVRVSFRFRSPILCANAASHIASLSFSLSLFASSNQSSSYPAEIFVALAQIPGREGAVVAVAVVEGRVGGG